MWQSPVKNFKLLSKGGREKREEENFFESGRKSAKEILG